MLAQQVAADQLYAYLTVEEAEALAGAAESARGPLPSKSHHVRHRGLLTGPPALAFATAGPCGGPSSGGLLSAGRARALAFTCRQRVPSTVPELANWQHLPHDRPILVPVSVGITKASEARFGSCGLRYVPLQKDREADATTQLSPGGYRALAGVTDVQGDSVRRGNGQLIHVHNPAGKVMNCSRTSADPWAAVHEVAGLGT
jgi:hypothetical protein